MKNLLCLCSAFKQSLVAGVFNNACYYETYESDASCSETMLINVDKMFKNAKVSANQVQEIAVVIGPGSFTGIRIAIAIAKGFVLAKPDIKLIAISSLRLLANKAAKIYPNKNIIAVMDGLSDNFFVTRFDCVANIFTTETCMNEQQLKAFVKPNDIMVCVKGEIEVENAMPIKIEANDLLIVAKELSTNQIFTIQNELLPNYLRLSQAEESLVSKQNKLHIELATENDAEELFNLSLQAFQNQSATKEMIIQELLSQNTKHFLAKINGNIKAFLTVMFAADECEILNIATANDSKNKGIATALITELLQHCKTKKINNIFLEVSKNNLPAISLYNKFGFENVSVRKHYYKNGDDALVMAKKL